MVQLTLAQTLRPAVLHKLDRSSVPVKINSVNPTNIVYAEASAPTVKKVIARNQVWKIVYSNGTTQVITPLTSGKPKPKTMAQSAPAVVTDLKTTNAAPQTDDMPAPTLATGSVPPAPSAPTSRSAAPQANVFSVPRDDEFNRLQVNIGPEFSFFPSFINKNRAWVNDTIGFGMKQNLKIGRAHV